MATPGKGISGRIASRVVSCVEVPLALIFLGVYIWGVVFYYWDDFEHCSSCVLEAILFGIYVVVAVVISMLLVLSTFTVFSLSTRKWIATLWCTFDMLSFIGTVVLICTHHVFEKNHQLFLLSVTLLLKWAVFFCVVCTYVWGISEKIQDNRMNRMPASPIRMGERRTTTLTGTSFWALRGKRGNEEGRFKISTKL